jgi:hypothetical protein
VVRSWRADSCGWVRARGSGGADKSSWPVEPSVRESPHAKLAFLDVVQANVGPVDPLTFFETVWEAGGILQGSDRLAHLPNARLLANGGMAAPGVVIKTPQPKGAPIKYQLVTSVSKAALELGPRAIQQDAVHVSAVRGCVPFVVVCDGHGYVNLLNNQPTDTSPDVRNTLHVGGRQVASSSLPPPPVPSPPCRHASWMCGPREQPLCPRALLMAACSRLILACAGRRPKSRARPSRSTSTSMPRSSACALPTASSTRLSA